MRWVALVSLSALIASSCSVFSGGEDNGGALGVDFSDVANLRCEDEMFDGQSDAASIRLIQESPMADNGIGRDFVVVGATRASLEDSHGLVLRGLCTPGPTGPVRQIHAIEGVDGLFVLLVDEVVRGVAVADRNVKSINGDIRVGDPLSTVFSSYEQRIAAGADDLEVGCSPGLFVAWQRNEYRLVFNHDGLNVTAIVGVGTGDAPQLTGDCSLPPREKFSVEAEQQKEQATSRTIDQFVPATLANTDLLIQDLSSADIDDPDVAQLWWGVSNFSGSNVVNFVALADSGLECLYMDDVVTVGIYDDPGAIVVAYERGAIDLLDTAACTIVDYLRDAVCPPGFLCPAALAITIAPSAGAYETTVDGRQFVVAYATFGGAAHAERICTELVGCEETFTPPDEPVQLDYEIPIVIPAE